LAQALRESITKKTPSVLLKFQSLSSKGLVYK